MSQSRANRNEAAKGGASHRTARPCPICGRPVKARAENPSFPFCQERCRLIDLGRWLGEEYRIAGNPAGDVSPPDPGSGDD
jgi:hypothetical protein